MLGARARAKRWGALAASLSLWARLADAGGPPGAQGSPLATSSYALDLFQGPVLAGSRVTGLAGAYAPIAEGSEGHLFHPASPAVRQPWSTRRLDLDLNLSLTLPSAVIDTDFDNNGTVGFSQKSFIWGTVGANVQYGPAGLGATVTAQNYDLKGTGSQGALNLTLITPHILGAWSFMRDQLQIGAGVRWINLSLNVPGRSDLFRISGIGFEAGAILALKGTPFRTSIAVRTPVSGSVGQGTSVRPDANGDLLLQGKYLPTAVRLPAEIEVGFACQFGRRQLNVGWVDQEAIEKEQIEPYMHGVESYPGAPKDIAHALARGHSRRLPREKLLIVGTLLLTAPTEAGIGLEGLLQQVVDRSGQRWSVSPRLGIEAEPWRDRLQFRAGSYIEPTRYVYSSYRAHGTASIDLKLFESTVFGLVEEGTEWRVGGAIDLSRQYFGSGFSFGIWR